MQTINLKKLQLINFQKHSNLQLQLSDGVNVLYGASEIGKSCIRRSIEFLCHHDTFKGQRKVGTKSTSVKGWFSNGISVERIISNSINRYIINKDGEEKIFDSVGRTSPEEVQQVIGIYPIVIDNEKIYLNSYTQVGKPFLFDQSPTDRAKLFNKLTGNDVLDKLFGEFNKDILRIKRNKKEEEEQFENREEQLKTKKVEMEKAVAVHKRLKIRLENIKKLDEKYSKLLRIKELMELNFEKKKNMLKILNSIKIPYDTDIKQLRIKITDLEVYQGFKNGLEKVNIGIDRVSGQLKDFVLVEGDYGGLMGKIERFERIRVVYEKLSHNQGLLSDFRKKLRIIDMDIDHGNKELKKYKICPTCEQEIK